MSTIKSLKAEFIKLKYPPVLWLIVFILLSTLILVLSSFTADPQKSMFLGVNPWIKLNASTRAIYSIFIGIPFVVLFISASVNIEHQNHGFKQLYTLPKKRSALIIYKLAALIISLIFITFLLIIGNILIGYILNWIYPESEFSYYSLSIWSSMKTYSYILISFLGVIGIQFFLSIRFKGFLLPACIGILGYVFGLIISSINYAFAIYFPYCHPTIARKNGVFDTGELNINQDILLNQVELFSIFVFVLFVCLSIFLEKSRSI